MKKKTLLMMASEVQSKYSSPIVAVTIDDEVHDLQSSYTESEKIDFIELTNWLANL